MIDMPGPSEFVSTAKSASRTATSNVDASDDMSSADRS